MHAAKLPLDHDDRSTSAAASTAFETRLLPSLDCKFLGFQEGDPKIQTRRHWRGHNGVRGREMVRAMLRPEGSTGFD